MIITEVSYDDYLAQLGEEVIDSYDTAGKAVTDIVDDLLAYQHRATKITKGTIAPTDTRALKVEGKTILCALLQLKESVGGYISVDNSRALQWANDIGEDKGQQIRYRKNLKGITKETNYNDLCTKLHMLGGAGIKLSDIDVVKEEATRDSDASYGYLTLGGKYACYKDWTAEGDALPGHITVYKELGAKISLTPINFEDADDGWNNEALAYDGNTATGADSNLVLAGAWTEYLAFDLGAPALLMNGMRFYPSDLRDAANHFNRVWVDISIDGIDWVNVYNHLMDGGDDWSNQWTEINFATQLVRGIRIRFNRHAGGTNGFEYLEELEGRTDYQDDTANWEQGVDEHIVRCAIGDYDAAATYYISYTHAGYLIAWDKITDGDDLFSRTLSNKYESYVLSLLEAGRLLLDEVKEVPINYSIRTVDLSESESLDLDFDALQKGSIVKIINEELGIDVKARIVNITKPDLLNPQNMEIEITTRLRDIADVIAGMYRELG